LYVGGGQYGFLADFDLTLRWLVVVHSSLLVVCGCFFSSTFYTQPPRNGNGVLFQKEMAGESRRKGVGVTRCIAQEGSANGITPPPRVRCVPGICTGGGGLGVLQDQQSKIYKAIPSGVFFASFRILSVSHGAGVRPMTEIKFPIVIEGQVQADATGYGTVSVHPPRTHMGCALGRGGLYRVQRLQRPLLL